MYYSNTIDESNPPRILFFKKKLIFILLFFTLTPLALITTVISLITITNSKSQVLSAKTINLPEIGSKVYASLPSETPSITDEIIAKDARPEILRSYISSYDSPLAPFATFLVEASDKYGVDWRLTTAIAMKESGLCRVIPEGSHNCWGWGIHSKGTLMFESYEEAIETVTKGLKENYIDKGYVTVDQIMKKYAHPDSTTWADGVNLYLNELN